VREKKTNNLQETLLSFSVSIAFFSVCWKTEK
jgi:hypothetical protein